MSFQVAELQILLAHYRVVPHITLQTTAPLSALYIRELISVRAES